MELLQLFAALIGLSLAMWGIWLAVEDAIGLTDSPPEDLRRLVALGNMRGQLARVSAHGVLVFVGIVSTLLPPPPLATAIEAAAELEQSTFIRIGLILVTTILVLDAIFERRQRYIFTERVGHIKSTSPASGHAHGVQDVSVRIGGQEVASGKVLQTTVQVPVSVPLTSVSAHEMNGVANGTKEGV